MYLPLFAMKSSSGIIAPASINLVRSPLAKIKSGYSPPAIIRGITCVSPLTGWSILRVTPVALVISFATGSVNSISSDASWLKNVKVMGVLVPAVLFLEPPPFPQLANSVNVTMAVVKSKKVFFIFTLSFYIFPVLNDRLLCDLFFYRP